MLARLTMIRELNEEKNILSKKHLLEADAMRRIKGEGEGWKEAKSARKERERKKREPCSQSADDDLYGAHFGRILMHT